MADHIEIDAYQERAAGHAGLLHEDPCAIDGAFTALAAEGTGDRTGMLVEYDKTTKIFENPSDKRTEDYISGRFG